MAQVIRTKLSAILPVIRQRIMDVTGFPAERVILAKRPLPLLEAPAMQYVTIQVKGASPDEPIFQGAGRVDTRHSRRLTVTARTWYDVDLVTDDAQWLLDPVNGHLDFEHKLFDALVCYQPTDSMGNWLVCQPLRVGPVYEPTDNEQEVKWGQSAMDVDMVYELDLDQSYQ